MSLECIELYTSGIQLKASGIEVVLEGVDLAEHRSQLVVHLTEADCAKDGIPVGVTEGEDGARAVGENFESISSIGHHGDEAESEHSSSDEGDNETHLKGVRNLPSMNTEVETDINPLQSDVTTPRSSHKLQNSKEVKGVKVQDSVTIHSRYRHNSPKTTTEKPSSGEGHQWVP